MAGGSYSTGSVVGSGRSVRVFPMSATVTDGVNVSNRTGVQGAYGLTFGGLPESRWLSRVPDSAGWGAVEVEVREGDAPASGDGELRIPLATGGYAVMDRVRRSAALVSPRVDPTRVVHPFLAAVGAMFARWDGREAVHGGAFLHAGGAWGVLGDQESGKSSLLARLALRGAPIVSDDLLVLAGTSALAGPRCLDLRDEAPERLGVTGRTELVREGERRRMLLEAVPLEVPLRGLFYLTWGSSTSIGRVAPAERIAELASRRTVRLAGGDSAMLLDLAAVPAWWLERPRGWDSLDEAVDRVLAVAAGH